MVTQNNSYYEKIFADAVMANSSLFGGVVPAKAKAVRRGRLVDGHEMAGNQKGWLADQTPFGAGVVFEVLNAGVLPNDYHLLSGLDGLTKKIAETIERNPASGVTNTPEFVQKVAIEIVNEIAKTLWKQGDATRAFAGLALSQREHSQTSRGLNEIEFLRRVSQVETEWLRSKK